MSGLFGTMFGGFGGYGGPGGNPQNAQIASQNSGWLQGGKPVVGNDGPSFEKMAAQAANLLSQFNGQQQEQRPPAAPSWLPSRLGNLQSYNQPMPAVQQPANANPYGLNPAFLQRFRGY